jgi:hypothetical protein
MSNSININENNNSVNLEDQNRSITVTDNNTGITTNVTQDVTNVVNVETIGPQGLQGPQGIQGPSGSQGPAGTNTTPGVISGSFQITQLGFVTSSATASFVSTGDHVSFASISASGDISSSGTIKGFTGSFGRLEGLSPITIGDPVIFEQPVTGSFFSGSFVGDGSNLINVTAIGTLSSSAQIATEISGAFGASSASFSARVTTLEGNPVFTSIGISGSFTAPSSSISTRITTLENNPTVTPGTLSGSAQIATEISGAFGAPSASFSTRITANESAISILNTSGLISSSAQIASNISGSFTVDSASFSTRVTANETNINDNRSLITGITSSLSTTGRMVFVGANGTLTSEAGFEYDAAANQLSVDSLNVNHLTSSFITSSRIYTSGSNIFGDDSSDTQTLIGTTIITGSAQITGSLTVSGIITGNGSGLTNVFEGTDASSSISTRLTSLETETVYSGSFSGSFEGDGSNLTGISGGGSTDTGSLMTTASIAGNDLTFTKGDASTFTITLPSGGGSTDTGSLMTTGSVSGNVLTFTKGDSSTFVLTVDTGSGSTGSDFTSAGISGSLGVNATLIRSLTAAGISGSFNASSASFSTRITSNETNITSLTAATSSYLTSLPTGVLSGSAQIASSISGSFGATSASFSTRVASLESNGVFTAAGISGSFVEPSASFSARVTTLEANPVFSSAGISGSFTAPSASFSTRVTSNTTNITSLTAATSSYLTSLPTGVLSGSAQIASNISGSFTATSSSLASRTSTLEGNPVFTAAGISGSLGDNATLIRSLTAAGISGSFAEPSASFSTRVTNNETNITSLTAATSSYLTSLPTGVLSGSAQIATEISGAFGATSSSLASRTSTLEDAGYITSAFPFNGDAVITGSLTVSGSGINITSGSITGDGSGLTNISSPSLNDITLGNSTIVGAGASSTTSYGTVFGKSAASTGGQNVGVGAFSNVKTKGISIGHSVAGGQQTVAIGYNAGHTNGEYNVLIGQQPGNNTSGNYNISLGYLAGFDQTTGTGNITIGSGSRGLAGESNQLRIGHGINGATISASLETGDIIFVSTASATYFVGDGSQLTNLPSSFTAAGISGSLGDNATLIRSLTANGISGSFTAPSASFSTRVTDNETNITSLTAATSSYLTSLPSGVVSGSAQIASDISGSFSAASASFSTRVTTNETDIATLTAATSSYLTATPTLQEVTDQGASTSNDINITGDLTASADISLPTNASSIRFNSAELHGRVGGSYPGLTINSGVSSGDRIWLRDAQGATGPVTMSFVGLGLISNIQAVQPASNRPFKIRGGAGPNDSNDGIQMYTNDDSNDEHLRFEIEADADTVDAYFTNINGLGINDTTPSAMLDVNGNINTTSHITASGNILATGTVLGSNLSGTNTGDQDLSSYALITAVSGAFASDSASFSTRVTTLEGNPVFTAAGISGSFTAPSASFSTRVTTLENAGSGETPTFIASGSTSASADPGTGVVVNHSGSTAFSVVGDVGTLFSVDDSLTGTLFSVNDISGFPVLQAESDGEVYIGKSPQSLYTTAVVSSTNANESHSLCTLSTSSYAGAFFEYTAHSASNARAGNIMSTWNGSNIVYAETTTTDIGDTSDLTTEVIISGSTARLVAYGANAGYKIKTIIKAI